MTWVTNSVISLYCKYLFSTYFKIIWGSPKTKPYIPAFFLSYHAEWHHHSRESVRISESARFSLNTLNRVAEWWARATRRKTKLWRARLSRARKSKQRLKEIAREDDKHLRTNTPHKHKWNVVDVLLHENWSSFTSPPPVIVVNQLLVSVLIFRASSEI